MVIHLFHFSSALASSVCCLFPHGVIADGLQMLLVDIRYVDYVVHGLLLTVFTDICYGMLSDHSLNCLCLRHTPYSEHCSMFLLDLLIIDFFHRD